MAENGKDDVLDTAIAAAAAPKMIDVAGTLGTGKPFRMIIPADIDELDVYFIQRGVFEAYDNIVRARAKNDPAARLVVARGTLPSN